MSRPLGPHTITVVVAGTTTDRGNNAVPDWSPAAVTESPPITGCFVQPRSSSENTDGRDQRITGWQLFAPGDTVLSALDRVRWNDLTLEVDGEVGPWSDRLGRARQLEVALKRVEG